MNAPAIPSELTYAGYGVYNNTIDVLAAVTELYNKGQRVFLADNQWGDPAPGERKYLYIGWTNGGNSGSGVVGERDRHGIVIP